jgi:hypothetical protein
MFQGGFAAEEMQVSVTFHTPLHPPPPPPSSDSPPASGDTTAAPLKKKAAPVLVAGIFPNDDNSLQTFDLSQSIAGAAAPAIGEGGQAAAEAAAAAALPPPPMVMDMRLTFMSSFDFYGRVTAYQLKVLGQEQEEEEGR